MVWYPDGSEMTRAIEGLRQLVPVGVAVPDLNPLPPNDHACRGVPPTGLAEHCLISQSEAALSIKYPQTAIGVTTCGEQVHREGRTGDGDKSGWGETARRRMEAGLLGLTTFLRPRSRVQSIERRLLFGVGCSSTRNVGGLGDEGLRDDNDVLDPSFLSFFRPNSPPNIPFFFFSFPLFVLSLSVPPFCSLHSFPLPFDLTDITELVGEAINPSSFIPLARFLASSPSQPTPLLVSYFL